ncbi:MAG: hypothetical protein EOO00_03235 [Chitinophagaceae bacterium]|nr:MAG: hypothetical protein EOO00_03235 [Chitinophagaceae bacterium]
MNYSLQRDQTGGSLPASSVSLQCLLDTVLKKLPASIQNNKVIIVNRIHPSFMIEADPVTLAPVVSELINTVGRNARNTIITVRAEKFRDTVMLVMEDPNNYNGYALSFSLMGLEEQARFIGGDISITGARQRVATVSLSFPGMCTMPFTAESWMLT